MTADIPDDISVSSIREAKIYVTRVDDCVLLRLCCMDDDHWFSIDREDFIRFAKYLAKDAEQLKGLH